MLHRFVHHIADISGRLPPIQLFSKSSFRNTMTTQWVQYLADVAVEEDEFSEEESSCEGEETSWRFMKNDDANVELQDDVIDLKLLRILKEEMEVICGHVLSKIDTQKDIMNEVVRIFVDPVLKRIKARKEGSFIQYLHFFPDLLGK